MVKSGRSTIKRPLILLDLNYKEVTRICSVAVKCLILHGIPIAKAGYYLWIDADGRKRGERTGLDTLVVHAVNDGY